MSRHRIRRRITVVIAGVVAVLLTAWIAFAVVVIGHPQYTQAPASADAIVVLGPSNKQVDGAVALAHRLRVSQLVLSIGDFPEQTGTCTQPVLQVTCFVPSPYTTTGEARAIGALAAARGWDSLIVIAPVPQMSRARMLLQRCYGGQLQLVATQGFSLSWAGWVEQAVYQTGGFVQAALVPGC